MLSNYVPILVLLAIATLFAVGSVAAGALIGPRRFNRAKIDAYECGIEPSPVPVAGGGRIPVKFYLTGMLFILFDVEVVFMYPYAVAAGGLGVFGLVAVGVFLLAVTIAFVYEWRLGGLDWD